MIVIFFQITIRSVTTVEISYLSDKKTIVEAQKYYEYFDVINVFTILIISFLILNTFWHLVKLNKYNQTRLEILTNLFKERELSKVDVVSSELEDSDVMIIDTWNRSIDELIEQGDKREKYFKQMVHDFNTPIQILKMNSEMNKMLCQSEYADAIDEEIVELENKITNYLMIDKISYFEKPNIQPVEFVSYLNNIENRFKILQLELDVVTEYQTLVYNTDLKMFDKILQNLIENAIKYSIDNRLKIELFEDKILLSNKVYVGMENENIFNRKQRVYSAKGNGIGSEIIRTYAELLDFEVSSEVIEDTFNVTLSKK